MRNEVELRRRADPVVRGQDSVPELEPPRGMFSFRYACTEVFTQGGNMHVRMKQTRYEDGRLRSEECEGTLDRHAAENLMVQAQQHFLTQAFGIARLLLAPFLDRRRN